MHTLKAENQNKRTKAYVDEVFRLIQKKPDVADIMILNAKGNPVKTTMEMNMAIQSAGLYKILLDKAASSLQKLHPYDELKMLRVKTNMHETFILPDGKITVIVNQKSIDRFSSQ